MIILRISFCKLNRYIEYSKIILGIPGFTFISVEFLMPGH